MHSTLTVLIIAGLCAMAGACVGILVLALCVGARSSDDAECTPRVCSEFIEGKPCTHLALPGELVCRRHLGEVRG